MSSDSKPAVAKTVIPRSHWHISKKWPVIIAAVGLVVLWMVYAPPLTIPTKEKTSATAVQTTQQVGPVQSAMVCRVPNPMPQWTVKHLSASDPASGTRWSEPVNVPASEETGCSVQVKVDSAFDGKYDWQCQDFSNVWHDPVGDACNEYKAIHFAGKDGSEMDLPVRLGEKR